MIYLFYRKQIQYIDLAFGLGVLIAEPDCT